MRLSAGRPCGLTLAIVACACLTLAPCPSLGHDMLAADLVVPVNLFGSNMGVLHAGVQLMLLHQRLCSWPSLTAWSFMSPSACQGVPALARSQCSPAGSRRMQARVPTPCAGKAPAPRCLIKGFEHARCNREGPLLVIVSGGAHTAHGPLLKLRFGSFKLKPAWPTDAGLLRSMLTGLASSSRSEQPSSLHRALSHGTWQCWNCCCGSAPTEICFQGAVASQDSSSWLIAALGT